jgi:hypothetical protein
MTNTSQKMKELYNTLLTKNDDKAKIEFLANKTEKELMELAQYAFKKPDADSVYLMITRVLISKNMEQLNSNSTEEEIKNSLKLDFLKNIESEGIERVQSKFAKKIKARGGSPKEAFEAIASYNPG